MNSRVVCGRQILHGTVFMMCVASSLAYGQEHRPESMSLRPLDSLEAIDAFRADSKFRTAASAVGMIDVRVSTGESVSCTGLIISATLVLTAKHCLEFEDPETGAVEQLFPQRITFVLDYLAVGRSSAQVQMKIEPVERGENVDYMLLQLSRPISIRGRTIPRLGKDPTDNEDLLIIHHPSAQPAKLSRFSCRATEKAIDGDFFNHTCATQQSSSGAPVFDSDFNLVGIHVRGGLSQIPGTFNRGILLSRVLQVSQVTRTALKARKTAVIAPPRPANQQKSTLSYKMADMRFVRRESGWLLLSTVDEAAMPKPLIAQTSADPSQVLLWSPGDDFLYQFPLVGGQVRRRLASDRQWANVGVAVKE